MYNRAFLNKDVDHVDILNLRNLGSQREKAYQARIERERANQFVENVVMEYIDGTSLEELPLFMKTFREDQVWPTQLEYTTEGTDSIPPSERPDFATETDESFREKELK